MNFLDNYAAERWETVLHYMVASSQQAGISEDAVTTLLQVRLVSCFNKIDNNLIQGKIKKLNVFFNFIMY